MASPSAHTVTPLRASQDARVSVVPPSGKQTATHNTTPPLRDRSLASPPSCVGNDSPTQKDALWCGRPTAMPPAAGPLGPSQLTPAAGGFGEISPSLPAPAVGAAGIVNRASPSTSARPVASTSAGVPPGAPLGASPTASRHSAASAPPVSAFDHTPDSSAPPGASTSRPDNRAFDHTHDSSAPGAPTSRPDNRTVLTTHSPNRSTGEHGSSPSSGLSSREQLDSASTPPSTSTIPVEPALADLFATLGIGTGGDPPPTPAARALGTSAPVAQAPITPAPAACILGTPALAACAPGTPAIAACAPGTPARPPSPVRLHPLTTPGTPSSVASPPVAAALPLNAATPHNSNREFISDSVVLFWKPPSCFSNWTSSPFTVLGVRYESGEQYLMSEKARLFNDTQIYSQIMASSSPRVHKDLGRRVRNFDHGRWERHREDIMLTGAYAKFAQNPILRQHLLSTGDRVLAEASPVDPLWGIGISAHHPDASFPSRWTGRNLLGKTLMEVRRLLQDSPGGHAHASPPPPLAPSIPPSMPRIHEIASPGTPSSPPEAAALSGNVTDAPGDHSAEVLHIASNSAGPLPASVLEYGPDLVGGTLLVDNNTFTTRVKLHSGPSATAQHTCTALLDSGSPASFVSETVVQAMQQAGALSAGCVRESPARSWGGFGDGPALQTTRSVRLSVTFTNGAASTASLATWASVVPSSTMTHSVLLGLDSFGRFPSRSFHTLQKPGSNGRIVGELTLSTSFSSSACAYTINEEAPAASFHLVYDGDTGISLGDKPVLVDVNLVRSSKMPALVGDYLVAFRPELGPLSSPEAFVSQGRQQIPLAGNANLEPGELLGFAAAPLLRCPFSAVFDSPPAPTSPLPDAPSSAPAPAPSPQIHTVHHRPSPSVSVAPASGPLPLKPSPADLLNRLTDLQRPTFLRMWDRLPVHMRDVVFELHDPRSSPDAIDRLGDALIEYADVFATSKSDFGACNIMPFSLSLPPGTKPVASKPYRINPILQKKVDAVLDQYLAAGLIQHSTSPWASPLVVIPKKDGSVRITVNYKRLNALIEVDGQPLPRVDGILDSLYKGKVFSIFDLCSAFHQIVADPDTVPLTAFCTPTQLFEVLRMPQGANASPGWFVKVINKVVHGLERIKAYLDDVICFDEDPLAHVLNMLVFFGRLRQYNLKLSPGKARIGATQANFLGHTISPAGVAPDSEKVRALAEMPSPATVKQLRSLLGGLSYYRKFLPNLSVKLRSLNALLKQGVKFAYTNNMKVIVKALLAVLSSSPTLVFPDWDAVADRSRPLRLCSDACIDGFGACLEQMQEDGSVKPIIYISRATNPAERNWTALDLEAGGIIWALRRLRGYLWSTHFEIYTDHQALTSIAKVGEHNARVQRWMEYLSNFTYKLIYRKGSANGNADFLSRLPLPAAPADVSGPDSIVDMDVQGIFLIRAMGGSYRSTSTPNVGLGGLRLPLTSGTFQASPLAPSDFGDFRRHGPPWKTPLAWMPLRQILFLQSPRLSPLRRTPRPYLTLRRSMPDTRTCLMGHSSLPGQERVLLFLRGHLLLAPCTSDASHEPISYPVRLAVPALQLGQAERRAARPRGPTAPVLLRHSHRLRFRPCLRPLRFRPRPRPFLRPLPRTVLPRLRRSLLLSTNRSYVFASKLSARSIGRASSGRKVTAWRLCAISRSDHRFRRQGTC